MLLRGQEASTLMIGNTKAIGKSTVVLIAVILLAIILFLLFALGVNKKFGMLAP